MRIGMLSYPMLFKRDVGQQAHIRETTRALGALQRYQGERLDLVTLERAPTLLSQFDLLHVFSSNDSNLKVLEAAVVARVPVVLTPLVSPGWDRASGEHARHADAHLDARRASLQSAYAHTRRALELASLVVAMGESERRAIEEGFLIDAAKVSVFSSGVSRHLFEADGELFRLRTGMRGPFVLMDGPISPYHNQLAMARALAEVALPLVLLGQPRERDQDYLRQLRGVRGVTCLSGLDDDARLLASAYAAASVLVLPSRGDANARTVLDALAAGTPVVTCAARSVQVDDSAFALLRVAPDDAHAQQRAVLGLLAKPPGRDNVRALARPYTWERAAGQLAAAYVALAGKGRAQSGGAACADGQGDRSRASASYTAV